ncbi:hypothetical protein BH23CHL2_BH23CHL2_09730 [soil metagenome]
MQRSQSSTSQYPTFQESAIYVRREIHDQYGGQRQGGISTPASVPAIFLFTGTTGQEHGYGFDHWEDSETFLYTGEGQPDQGDMTFVRGNKAIRDHQENDKRVYLFEILPKTPENRGKARFRSELELRDYQIIDRDSTGIPRKVIVFRFKRVSG